MRLSSAVGTNNTLLSQLIDNAQGTIVPPGQLVIDTCNESVAQGPHVLANRATYTVPSNKVAILYWASLTIGCRLVPSVIGDLFAQLKYTPIDASGEKTILEIVTRNVTVGDYFSHSLACKLVMLTSDTLIWESSDVGLITLNGWCYGTHLIEYDRPPTAPAGP